MCEDLISNWRELHFNIIINIWWKYEQTRGIGQFPNLILILLVLFSVVLSSFGNTGLIAFNDLLFNTYSIILTLKNPKYEIQKRVIKHNLERLWNYFRCYTLQYCLCQALYYSSTVILIIALCTNCLCIHR